jgi:CheY-like chemotaxis protein
VAGALGLLLGAMGHEVRELHGSGEVMGVVAKFHPELVLLDLEMPEQDGFQVARQLRKHHAPADLKLVALSGYGGEHIRQRAREAGFDWYLLKPADWDSLMTLLEDLHWPGLQPSP